MQYKTVSFVDTYRPLKIHTSFACHFQVTVLAENSASRSVSVMTNQSEEFNELVKLKSQSTLLPAWNINWNNVNSAAGTAAAAEVMESDEELAHSTHLIQARES